MRVLSSALLALSLFSTAYAHGFEYPIEHSSTLVTTAAATAQQQEVAENLTILFKSGLQLSQYIRGASDKEPASFKEWMQTQQKDKPTALHQLRQLAAGVSAESFAASYAAHVAKAKPSDVNQWLQLQSSAPWSETLKTQWSPNFLLDSPIQWNSNNNHASAKYLVAEQSPANSKTAVLFVGGVNDTYKFWAAHMRDIDEHAAVFGYEGPGGPGTQPHNIDYMEANAQHLSDALVQLSEQGIENVHIIAHSLGGVVSKKALLLMDAQQGNTLFKHITFTAVSSPFGGFASADTAPKIPLFKTVSKWFNIAMASDMGPSSPFYQSISKDLPSYIQSHLIESPNDPVVKNDHPLVAARYEAVTKSFQQKTSLDGGGSHVYAKDPAFFKASGMTLIPTIDISHRSTPGQSM